MKKKKDYGIYDFSDYAEEITGEDLVKINGGANTGCNGGGPKPDPAPTPDPVTPKPKPTTPTNPTPTTTTNTPQSGNNGTKPENPNSEYAGVPPQYWTVLDEQQEKNKEKKEVKEPIMSEHIYSEYYINKYVPEQYKAAALKALQLEEMQGLYGAPTDSKRTIQGIGVKTDLQDAHTGVDVGAIEAGKKGDPIYATADGEVLRNSKTNKSGSTILELSLPFTKDTAVYQHAQFIVSEGDTVKRGQIIGYMSDEGTAGQVHLHYEIRKNGVYKSPIIDPLPHMPLIYTENLRK